MTETINEQFERQMKADGWEEKDGRWYKSTEAKHLDLQTLIDADMVVNSESFNGAPSHALLLRPSLERIDGNRFRITLCIIPHPDMDGIGYDSAPDGTRFALYRERRFKNITPA